MNRRPLREGRGEPPKVIGNRGLTTFMKTTSDISLDSQISLLPLGFSLLPENPQGNQEIDQGIEEEMSVDYVLPLEVSSRGLEA